LYFKVIFQLGII